MQLVAALDAVPGMRAVLGLFEGVCTGAADGYARMTGRPALTLLHLGPGFANGIANLHNARRAHSPVVNLIGDHASWHLAADAPLTSDIASLASPVSGWVRQLRDRLVPGHRRRRRDRRGARSARSGRDADRPAGLRVGPLPRARGAREAARARSGQRRCAWRRPRPRSRAERPERCSSAVSALRAPALRAAARIAAATGCALIHETFAARVERGAGLPAVERLPYFPEQGADRLRPLAHLVLAGAREPVAFFGYPDHPSRLVAGGTRDLAARRGGRGRRGRTRSARAAREGARARLGRDTRARRAAERARSRPARSVRRSRRSNPRTRSSSTRAPRAASPTSRSPLVRRRTTAWRSPAARSARGCPPRSAPRSRAPTAR